MDLRPVTTALINGRTIKRMWLGRVCVWPDPWEDVWADGGIPPEQKKETENGRQ